MTAHIWRPRIAARASDFDANIVLDRQGLILELNSAAQRLTSRGNLISGNVGVGTWWAWDELQREMDQRLRQRERQLVAVADPTGVRHCVILTCETDMRGAAWTTLHIRDVFGAVAEQVRLAATLFRLTPSEHQLAESMLLGRTLDMHAQLRGSTVSTVRKQLSSIFVKTGTSRQHEMAATLQAVSGMPAEPAVSALPMVRRKLS